MKAKITGVFIACILAGSLFLGACNQQIANPESTDSPANKSANNEVSGPVISEIWNTIIPEPGTDTLYGISLSLDNTQQFIDWYNSIVLSENEKALRDEALSQLVAPCCDDHPASEC